MPLLRNRILPTTVCYRSYTIIAQLLIGNPVMSTTSTVANVVNMIMIMHGRRISNVGSTKDIQNFTWSLNRRRVEKLLPKLRNQNVIHKSTQLRVPLTLCLPIQNVMCLQYHRTLHQLFVRSCQDLRSKRRHQLREILGSELSSHKPEVFNEARLQHSRSEGSINILSLLSVG